MNNVRLSREYLELPTKSQPQQRSAATGSPNDKLTNVPGIERSPEISWNMLNYTIHKKSLLKNCWGTVSQSTIKRIIHGKDEDSPLLNRFLPILFVLLWDQVVPGNQLY